ncbi:hypothetical protein T12_1709 [Trichinella patagoniensis]|uniref:Uncharacterized protein n=1 Tax=Trichinella patagoniensis TaxID=990121 RepID=A0A0V1AAT6_9BILA|nr:hypothetical protein T12_1709 [Trichinella patagoniensis]
MIVLKSISKQHAYSRAFFYSYRDSNPDMTIPHNLWQVIRLRHVHCPNEIKIGIFRPEPQDFLTLNGWQCAIAY